MYVHQDNDQDIQGLEQKREIPKGTHKEYMRKMKIKDQEELVKLLRPVFDTGGHTI